VGARSFLAFLAVLALVGLLGFGLLGKGSSVSVGDEAPDRPLPRLEGDGEVAIADFRGRWVLVNLWASWCDPCRDEAPDLERFWRRHRGGDIAVLGLNVQDNSEDAIDFVREYGLTYPQVRSVGEERSDAFGSTGVPENFLVDPEGRLAMIWRGPLDERLLRERVLAVVEDRT